MTEAIMSQPPTRRASNWMEDARCAGLTHFADYDRDLVQPFCDGCPVKLSCEKAGMRPKPRTPKNPTDQCKVCNTTFQSTEDRTTFCGRDCSKKANLLAIAERLTEKNRERGETITRMLDGGAGKRAIAERYGVATGSITTWISRNMPALRDRWRTHHN